MRNFILLIIIISVCVRACVRVCVCHSAQMFVRDTEFQGLDSGLSPVAGIFSHRAILST